MREPPVVIKILLSILITFLLITTLAIALETNCRIAGSAVVCSNHVTETHNESETSTLRYTIYTHSFDGINSIDEANLIIKQIEPSTGLCIAIPSVTVTELRHGVVIRSNQLVVKPC